MLYVPLASELSPHTICSPAAEMKARAWPYATRQVKSRPRVFDSESSAHPGLEMLDPSQASRRVMEAGCQEQCFEPLQMPVRADSVGLR